MPHEIHSTTPSVTLETPLSMTHASIVTLNETKCSRTGLTPTYTVSPSAKRSVVEWEEDDMY